MSCRAGDGGYVLYRQQQGVEGKLRVSLKAPHQKAHPSRGSEWASAVLYCWLTYSAGEEPSCQSQCLHQRGYYFHYGF